MGDDREQRVTSRIGQRVDALRRLAWRAIIVEQLDFSQR
jgi:hypothetical protein